MSNPYLHREEDGTINAEWLAKDFSFGFTIAPTLEESGWYFVSKQHIMACGKIDKEVYDSLVELSGK